MSDQLSEDLRSLRIDRDASAAAPPSSRGRILAGLAAALVLLALGALGAQRLSANIFRTEVSLTEVSLVSPATSSTLVTATGYVQPGLRSYVGAKVPGRVSRVLVREGDVVKAGATLLELEAADQRSAVAAARARVAAARARAEAARANAAELNSQLGRARALAKTGASPASLVEDLQTRAGAAQQLVSAADADIAALEAEASTLALTLGYLTISAPIAGTVVTRPPEVGEVLTDQSVLELVDMASLVVEVDVPEGRLGLVARGAPAEIVLEAYPSERRRGEVAEIGSKVNRAKATVVVKVRFSDGAERALPDMAARVSILREALDERALKAPPKLVVPKVAVTERAGASVVFVVDGEAVRMTPVTLGEPVGEGFELKSGPPAGTKLVREPAGQLADGQKVKEQS